MKPNIRTASICLSACACVACVAIFALQCVEKPETVSQLVSGNRIILVRDAVLGIADGVLRLSGMLVDFADCVISVLFNVA